ncbi:carboxypeptidase regulatory-like domain-containing protein [Streptomyces endophyticus]|uniref:Carboxypeptidase regulatory-like domain-containing protein n=1 Tax=Streptomyces endophyticus TaxID=714166 RepID=A0ABU6FEP3_9ACTN|nr:carboxypeptidase regulatory-like domain-containing protein [Streptomyces endophyticus]MEB8342515.1 carboxypeptidase regulatory-like domain-containing protein [Streptomyces endophyticus]
MNSSNGEPDDVRADDTQVTVHAERPVEEKADSSAKATAVALLQSLWFPALFFAGFLCCYLLAFHNPTPHHLKIAVPSAAASQLQAGFDKSAPGGFTMVPIDGGADLLKEVVLHQDAVAAYMPATTQGGTAHLYVAGASGAELTLVPQQAFEPVAAASGSELKVTDLAPTVAKDGMGTSIFYLSLALTIPSYIMVMMMLRATTLTRLKKVATFLVSGAVFAVVGFYATLAMGAIPDRPVSIVFMFMLTTAVSLVCYGLAPFVRQFFPGVAVTIFVLLAMPSSGGAVPVQMVPGFFRALHPILPLGNLVSALRSHFYFDDNDLAQPVLVLSIWIVAGIALILLGALLEQYRVRAAAASGGVVSVGDQERQAASPAVGTPRPQAYNPALGRNDAAQPDLVGRVLGDRGDPFANVLVAVLSTSGKTLVHTRTDAEGWYRFTTLPEGTLIVLAGLHRHAPAVSRVQIAPGYVARQDFVMHPLSSDQQEQPPTTAQ